MRLIHLLTLVAYLIGLPVAVHAHGGHGPAPQAAAGEHRHEHGRADCTADGGCFTCPCPVMPYAGTPPPSSPIAQLEFIARQETKRTGIMDLPIRPPKSAA